MKRVKLFTIKTDEASVGTNLQHWRFRDPERPHQGLSVSNTAEEYIYKDSVVGIERLVKLGQNEYVAIHPAVEEVVDAVLGGRLKKTREQFVAVCESRDSLYQELADLRVRVCAFNALPWYKRLLQGKISVN